MKTIFLKFADEAEAMTLLFNEEQAPLWPNTDVVGVIYQPTGATLTNDEGIEYPEMHPTDGFHVNIAADNCPDELRQYEVFPASPSRVFGGLD